MHIIYALQFLNCGYVVRIILVDHQSLEKSKHIVCAFFVTKHPRNRVKGIMPLFE